MIDEFMLLSDHPRRIFRICRALCLYALEDVFEATNILGSFCHIQRICSFCRRLPCWTLQKELTELKELRADVEAAKISMLEIISGSAGAVWYGQPGVELKLRTACRTRLRTVMIPQITMLLRLACGPGD